MWNTIRVRKNYTPHSATWQIIRGLTSLSRRNNGQLLPVLELKDSYKLKHCVINIYEGVRADAEQFLRRQQKFIVNVSSKEITQST